MVKIKSRLKVDIKQYDINILKRKLKVKKWSQIKIGKYTSDGGFIW